MKENIREPKNRTVDQVKHEQSLDRASQALIVFLTSMLILLLLQI